MGLFRRLVGYLAATRAGQLGVALATAAGLTIASFFTADFFGVALGPYAGLIGFIALPAVLVLGLILIAAGMARRGVSSASPDMIRQTGIFIAAMTVVNLLILLSASYKAVRAMDSEQFCGQTCHVMRPQFLAHARSPHAKIACPECHVAAGIGGMINAKMAGARQLVLYLTGTYSRPIHGDAKENCVNCHTAPAARAQKIVTRVHFADDAANTRSSVSLSIHTGAIHTAHAATHCAACHNRAGHAVDTAESAVEAAFIDGRLDQSIPFLKKQAVAALAANSPAPAAAARALAEIRATHLFPEMKIDWATYPTRLGHADNEGCFRCHDGGKAKNDCDTCHSFVEIKNL